VTCPTPGDNPRPALVVPRVRQGFVDTQAIPYTHAKTSHGAEAWINDVLDKPNYAKLIRDTPNTAGAGGHERTELNPIDPKVAGPTRDQPAGGLKSN